MSHSAPCHPLGSPEEQPGSRGAREEWGRGGGEAVLDRAVGTKGPLWAVGDLVAGSGWVWEAILAAGKWEPVMAFVIPEGR